MTTDQAIENAVINFLDQTYGSTIPSTGAFSFWKGELMADARYGLDEWAMSLHNLFDSLLLTELKKCTCSADILTSEHKIIRNLGTELIRQGDMV